MLRPMIVILSLVAAACGSPGEQGAKTATPTPDAHTAPATTSDAAASELAGVPEGHYVNPVFEPVFADPSVIRADDGLFYAFATEDDWGDGKGPRPIPIIRSEDLVAWEYVGEAFAAGERPDWKAAYLWAPDINRVGDRYLLYYSMSLWGDTNPGIGVASADAPEGPYQDHGKLFASDEIGVENSIDPMLFDDNGVLYLFWGSFHGIYGIELAEDGLSTAGEKFHIAGNAFEAPYILERDGAYWFFGSTGSCCEGASSTYAVAVGRADQVEGPYVDADGVDLLKGSGTEILHGGEEFVGPGHNAVVQDDTGADWLVYHAIDPEQPTAMSGAPRRPLLIDPLLWEDGWPLVDGRTPSAEPRPAPQFDATPEGD